MPRPRTVFRTAFLLTSHYGKHSTGQLERYHGRRAPHRHRHAALLRFYPELATGLAAILDLLPRKTDGIHHRVLPAGKYHVREVWQLPSGELAVTAMMGCSRLAVTLNSLPRRRRFAATLTSPSHDVLPATWKYPELTATPATSGTRWWSRHGYPELAILLNVIVVTMLATCSQRARSYPKPTIRSQP